MPILLALTIRAARSVQEQAPIPRQLQFHEDQSCHLPNQDIALQPMPSDQEQQHVLDQAEAQIQYQPHHVPDEPEGLMNIQGPSQAPKLANIIEEIDFSSKDNDSN